MRYTNKNNPRRRNALRNVFLETKKKISKTLQFIPQRRSAGETAWHTLNERPGLGGGFHYCCGCCFIIYFILFIYLPKNTIMTSSKIRATEQDSKAH